jgi:hypothetical protein
MHFNFRESYACLRANRVTTKTSLQTLRKEFESIIATEQGIYAASRLLRHADITTSSSVLYRAGQPAVCGFPLFSSPPMLTTSKSGGQWKRAQSDSSTSRSARIRYFKLSVLLWESNKEKPNVKNKTRSGHSVPNVSLPIGRTSLQLQFVFQEDRVMAPGRTSTIVIVPISL